MIPQSPAGIRIGWAISARWGADSTILEEITLGGRSESGYKIIDWWVTTFGDDIVNL
jgi:hypothetical protein